MEFIRQSSENEMILEFLKAEYFSERFSDQLKNIMKKLHFNDKIITCADLNNAEENHSRKKLLSDYRGYGADKELFENFPNIIEWKLCRFEPNDLRKIRYINYSYWNELSMGTHYPLDAVQTIRNGRKIYGQDNSGFLNTAAYIKKGGTFPKMFFITADFSNFVIVEGHLRMTAYALVPQMFNNVECIIGKCNVKELELWL